MKQTIEQQVEMEDLRARIGMLTEWLASDKKGFSRLSSPESQIAETTAEVAALKARLANLAGDEVKPA